MTIDINDLDLMNQPDEGDPLVWLRKHREELSKQYPTVQSLGEYYRQFNSIEAAQERINAKKSKIIPPEARSLKSER